jgi:protein-S-isoprenylcysteine O-methyltransferase Ste14
MMKKLLENSANQLFRFRGQIPLILVLIAILVIYFNHSLTFFEEILGKTITSFITISFVFIGHLTRALAIGFRGVHSSGQNRHEQVAENLNTNGLYSITRHPLYLGNFFIWTGVFIWVGDLWFLLLGYVFFFMLYIPIMNLENNFLEKKFGEKYSVWAKKTPMFIPKFKFFILPENQFSLRLVWKNEYPGIVSTLSSIWFVSLLRLIFFQGKIGISVSLLVFAFVIIVFGIGSRYLKHKTQFFPKIG